ncbi:reverse transcriptase domain-containing protein [Tanacetum coccineum]|uniref:Reverse transcriptase domain-containing protein n=1 Tax=Tanacetum coccineum TaxID=301880 RepID=A0ABQ4XFM0_9ASTR
MPFGLRNAGATYQRLVDKAFHGQIGRNLEVYVDDLVIKAATNGRSCRVNTKGIKICPDKVDAVLSLQSPKCLKDVQKLNGKLASLNRCCGELKEKSVNEREVLAWYRKRELEDPDLMKTTRMKLLPAERKKARAIKRPSQANYVLREIHEGSCSMLAGTRSVVAKALRTGYYWLTMHKDARALIKASGPFPEGPGKVKFLIVAMDYFTKWIEAKLVATITGNQVKKFVWENIVCRFGLPGEIISDNGKQFRDNPFRDWCEKLCIQQHFASVKHPQTNGLVERANRSLGEGIKARLGKDNKNWLEEISHVLWAHRTMIKSSNGNTPFSLTTT